MACIHPFAGNDSLLSSFVSKVCKGCNICAFGKGGCHCTHQQLCTVTWSIVRQSRGIVGRCTWACLKIQGPVLGALAFEQEEPHHLNGTTAYLETSHLFFVALLCLSFWPLPRVREADPAKDEMLRFIEETQARFGKREAAMV